MGGGFQVEILDFLSGPKKISISEIGLEKRLKKDIKISISEKIAQTIETYWHVSMKMKILQT